MKSLLDRIKDRCRVDEDGCWVWMQGTSDEGYPVMNIAEFNNVSSLYVRRIVFVLAVDQLHARRRVASTCENKLCCNPEHLFSATESQLARTEFRKEKAARGLKHSLALRGAKRSWKLSYEKAEEIRRLRRDGMARDEVAKLFDVNPCIVSQITTGKLWVRSPWAI